MLVRFLHAVAFGVQLEVAVALLWLQDVLSVEGGLSVGFAMRREAAYQTVQSFCSLVPEDVIGKGGILPST